MVADKGCKLHLKGFLVHILYCGYEITCYMAQLNFTVHLVL